MTDFVMIFYRIETIDVRNFAKRNRDFVELGWKLLNCLIMGMSYSPLSVQVIGSFLDDIL